MRPIDDTDNTEVHMTLKKLTLIITTVLLSAALLADNPESLRAAECEGPGSLLCEEHETCVNLLFAKFCSKEYEYYDDSDCLYCHY